MRLRGQHGARRRCADDREGQLLHSCSVGTEYEFTPLQDYTACFGPKSAAFLHFVVISCLGLSPRQSAEIRSFPVGDRPR
jgi:hypothetical protein